MIKHRLGKHLSEIATASIIIMRSDDLCRICGEKVPKGTQAISGTSFNEKTGYQGGFYHLQCWLPNNYHPYNERTIEMAKKNFNTLGPPKARNLSDTTYTASTWDYTHSDLVDKPIIISKVREITTRYGPAYVCEVWLADKKISALIGAMVLVQTLDDIKDQLPVKLKIAYNGKYYEFVDTDEEPEEKPIPY